MDNFDLKKYLVENKRTRNSKDLLTESVDFKENDKVKYQGKDYYVVVSATDNAYIEPNNFSKEFADARTTKDSFVILSPESLEYGETLSDDQIKSALNFYIITDKSKVEPTNSRMVNENKQPEVGDKVDVANPKGKYSKESQWGPDEYLYNAEVININGQKITVKDANDDEYEVDIADVTV